MGNLEFEIECVSVQYAQTKIKEIRASFGDDVYILVKFANSNKNAILKQLDEVCAQLEEKIKEAR